MPGAISEIYDYYDHIYEYYNQAGHLQSIPFAYRKLRNYYSLNIALDGH
jgi:hypothetical protein